MKKFFSSLLPRALLLTALAFAACPTDTDSGKGKNPGQSVMPAIGQTTVAKDSAAQTEVKFAVTGAAPAANAVFKVYANNNTSATIHTVVSAEFRTAGSLLVLKATTNVPDGIYYVSVTEAPKTESTRVALTVAAAGVSVMPTISPTAVAKYAPQQIVVAFTVTGSPPAANAVFKVYEDNTTNTIHNTVSAEFEAGSLVLKAATDVPADIYYVSVTEAPKTESARVALTVEEQGVTGTTEVTFNRTLGYFPFEPEPFGTAIRYVSDTITQGVAPIPVRPGFDFAGWYDGTATVTGGSIDGNASVPTNGSGEQIIVGPVGTGTPITGPRTVYAKWEWAVPFTRLEYAVNEAGNAFTGTFYDADGNQTGNTHNAELSGATITDEKGYKVVSINGTDDYIKLHEIAASPLNGGNPNPLYTDNGVGWAIEIYYYQPDNTTNYDLLSFYSSADKDKTAGALWAESYRGKIVRSPGTAGTYDSVNSHTVRNRWANVIYVGTGSYYDAWLDGAKSPTNNNRGPFRAIQTADFSPFLHNYIGRGMTGGKIYKVIIHSTRRGLDGSPAPAFPPAEKTDIDNNLDHLKNAVAATFNPGGGNWDGDINNKTIYRAAGAAFGSFFPADPEKDGQYFWGWNTASSGSGDWISAATVMPSSAITYYAVWKNEPAANFNITLPAAGSVNATIMADKEQARAGEVVTVTVRNNVGYRLSSVAYRETGQSGGTDLTKSPADWKNWIFTMPAYDVTVTAALTAVAAYTTMWNFTELNGGNVPLNPNATQGWWNGFNNDGAVFMSNSTGDPSGSGVAHFTNFTTLGGTTVNLPNNRSRCIGVGRATNTTAATQRWGGTFLANVRSRDYSGNNKVSLYIRSMYPLNKYYFSLCNGGVYNATMSEAVIGTQYRYEFSVLDYANKYGNGDVAQTYGNNLKTPKWMKIVIDLDDLVGPSGAPPFDPSQVTGWVFGFAEDAFRDGNNQDTINSSLDGGACLDYNYNGTGYYRAERTFMNWIVFEAYNE